MHCVVAIMYGFIIWLATLAYALIVGGNIGRVLILTPFIVSGASAVILTIDLLLWWVITMIRRRFLCGVNSKRRLLKP